MSPTKAKAETSNHSPNGWPEPLMTSQGEQLGKSDPIPRTESDSANPNDFRPEILAAPRKARSSAHFFSTER